MAMKQLIVKLSRKDFDLSSISGDMWQHLEAKLIELCDGSTNQREELKSLIEWSQEKELRERRNDAIHGFWWTYDIGSVRNIRYKRNGSSALIRGSLRDICNIGDAIFEYATKLEAVCGNEWPHALLARGGARASSNPDNPFPIELFAEKIIE